MKHGVYRDTDILRFNRELREAWGEYPPIADMPLPEARRVAEKVRSKWARGGPEMAVVRNSTIELPSGPLAIRVHHPAKDAGPSPALVYLHGGGFVMFSVDTHDRLMREYAALGRFAVIGVDYPLAPEHKYPAPLDRLTEFVLWLGRHAESLDVDAERLALGGDSAGGNLSVATCLRLRDIGKLHLVKAVLSNYGGFSAVCSDEAEAEFGGPDAVLHRDEIDFYWRQYLNGPDERRDPYACPVNAELTGLPPVFLAIPDLDVVSEHSFEMARKLDAAGVPCEARVYRGATHSFIEAVSISPLARGAIADGAGFVASHLFPGDRDGLTCADE